METESNLYYLSIDGKILPSASFNSKEYAERDGLKLSHLIGKEIQVVQVQSVISCEKSNITPDAYETACEYLGIPYLYHLDLELDNIGISGKYTKAISAIYKLIIIAEAWNKEDCFVPDFSNCNQLKWSPWFVYSNDAAGFSYAYSDIAATAADIKSRLCFGSKKRATEFGEQFIDLWNDFLVNN